MLVSGSKGKMGATVLASRAAFKAGVGLLTIHAPGCGLGVLQNSVPEAMVNSDNDQDQISFIEINDEVDAISIGPAIGQDPKTVKALLDLLGHMRNPMVLDADALNILAANKDYLRQLPSETILTPHPGEFRRLVGPWKSDFHKLELLRDFCRSFQVNTVLKGAYSAVCNTSGEVFFNSTGNPGMATAGSGDVLTGIIGALLAQKLKPFDALRLGVYLHGLSGDLAKSEKGEISLNASDIIEAIPESILSINHTTN